MAATGTDPRAVDRALTTPMRFRAPTMMDGEETALEVTGDCQPRKPLKLIGVADDCGDMMANEKTSGGWDRTSDTRLMKPLL